MILFLIQLGQLGQLGPFLSQALGSGYIPSVLSNGVVYPGFNMASLINPSDLGLNWGSAFQLLYAPQLPNKEVRSHAISYRHSGHYKFGFELGYLGTLGFGTARQGAFAGMGFRQDFASLGLSLRETSINDGFSPQVDFGTTFDLSVDTRAAIVLYGIGAKNRMTVGLGSNFGSFMDAEINFLIPGFSEGTSISGNYGILTGTNLYFGSVGFNFGLLYQLQNQVASTEISGTFLARLSESVDLTFEYRSTNEYIIGLAWGMSPPDNELQGMEYGPALKRAEQNRARDQDF